MSRRQQEQGSGPGSNLILVATLSLPVVIIFEAGTTKVVQKGLSDKLYPGVRASAAPGLQQGGAF